MTFTYENNDQFKSEIQRFFKESKIKQKDISANLEVSPQRITNILNKKFFRFDEISKILSAVGYSLVISFEPKPKLSVDDRMMEYLYRINGRPWPPEQKRKPVMSDEEYNSLKFPWEK